MQDFETVTGPTARRSSWQERGYVIERGVLDGESVALLRAEADRLYDRGDLVSQDNLRCRWANHVDTGACRLDALDPVSDLSSTFAEAVHDARLSERVADLYGEPACLFKDKLIYKPPGAPGYDLHQDWIAWEEFPTSFATIAVALDSSGPFNGGTELFPGLHQQGSLVPDDGHFNRLDPSIVASTPGEIPTLEPGDAVIFGGYVPHRSGPNESDGWRRLLYVSFNRESDGGDQRERHLVQFHAWLKQQYAAHGRFGVSFR